MSASRISAPKAIGIDYGTSSTRALLVDAGGRVVAQAVRPSPVIEAGRSFLEQNMETSVNAGLDAVREVLQTSGVNRKDIVGIAASGWMHGDVILGHDGKVLANASMWNCPRSVPEYERIMADRNLVDAFVRNTGNGPAVRWTIVKALHRMKQQPALWAKTEAVVTPKDYWNYFLTGELRQERSDMIGAVGINGKYAGELFKKLGFTNRFVRLADPADMVGILRDDIAEQTGLPKGLKVFAGGGDQQCGRIGMGVVSPGIVGFNLGTSGVTTAFNPDRVTDPDGEIHYFGDWLMACCMSSGGSLSWFLDILNAGRVENRLTFDSLLEMAAGIPAGADGVTFLPFLSGGNHPVRDPNMRAVFTGMTGSTGAGTLARAVVEGVAIEMVMCALRMKEMGIDVKSAYLAGGGARDKTGTWPQIFADALGVPVTLNEVEDASALGAAIVAFVGAGVYKNYGEACAEMVKRGRTFEPNPANADVYERLMDRYFGAYEGLSGEREE